MHYSPGGLLLYEIMQNSDVTIGLGPRLASMDAEEREPRIARALAAVHLEDGFDPRTQPVTIPTEGGMRTFVLVCEEFALERLDLEGPCRFLPDGSAPGPGAGEGRRFCVLTCVEGMVDVLSDGNAERLLAGQTCLLPAALGPVTVAPSGRAAVLRGSVPDLVRDVIAPLRASGVADDAIRGLGGTTGMNRLSDML
jgi:mannose-6-phosphate isomerase class I